MKIFSDKHAGKVRIKCSCSEVRDSYFGLFLRRHFFGEPTGFGNSGCHCCYGNSEGKEDGGLRTDSTSFEENIGKNRIISYQSRI